MYYCITFIFLITVSRCARTDIPIAQTHRHNAHARTRAAARGTPLREVRRCPTRRCPTRRCPSDRRPVRHVRSRPRAALRGAPHVRAPSAASSAADRRLLGSSQRLLGKVLGGSSAAEPAHACTWGKRGLRPERVHAHQQRRKRGTARGRARSTARGTARGAARGRARGAA